MVRNRNQTILIVEDNPEDYEASVRAFKKSGISNNLKHCTNGKAALDYLFRQGDYANPDTSPRPGIILLDLNLPKVDGRKVLSELKSCDDLKRIPVVVFTTSTDERDIEYCYGIGANTYIEKPVDITGFFDAIARLKDYWIEIAVLPENIDK